MTTQRIDAPAKIIDAVQNAQRTVERINLEVQAMEFGARVALDVPEVWVWDGSGWVAPERDTPPR
jgi:hypothetical protein